MKYFSIDVETTGLDWSKDQLVEIGIVYDDVGIRKPISELPRFHCYVVSPRYTGDPVALAMHAESFRRIAEKRSPYNYYRRDEVIWHLTKWMVGILDVEEPAWKAGKMPYSINLAAKNGVFDLLFMNQLGSAWMEGTKFYFSGCIRSRARILDPGSLYFNPKVDKELPNLGLCMERAGVKGEVKHTAVEDAINVIEVIRVHCKSALP